MNFRLPANVVRKGTVIM